MKETISTGITETIPTFEEVWKSHKNLIYKIMLKMNVDNQHKDDLIQCGKIGIHRAIATYQPEKGGKFISWVITYVKKEMIEYLNQNLRIVRIPVNQLKNKERLPQPTDTIYSLDEPFQDSGDSLYSTIAYDDEEYTETDTSLLKEAISTLKPQWQTIMSMISEGKEIKEIAEYLGISRQAAYQQKEKAIKQLQKIMVKSK